MANTTCRCSIRLLILGLLYYKVLCSKQEYDLKQKLRTGYDVTVRPILDFRKPVLVNIDLALNQIIDLNEREQSLVLALWMRLSWVDEHLTWNASSYNGLDHIGIVASQMWVPDIVVTADIREEEKEILKFHATLHHNGNVFFNYPLLLKISCKLDVTYFPFDKQSCALKFGSWTFDGAQINVSSRTFAADLNNYVSHGEWDLLDMKAKYSEIKYSCTGCDNPYPDVTFFLRIERKPLYYFFNLILPCIFAVIVTLLGFFLPTESGEKVSLGVTVLLTITVFLLLVAESTPPQSEVIPLISLYFGVMIVIVAVSTALTVVVVHIHYRGSGGIRVPRKLRKMVIIMGKVMCVGVHAKEIRIYEGSAHECEESHAEKLKSNGTSRVTKLFSKNSGKGQPVQALSLESILDDPDKVSSDQETKTAVNAYMIEIRDILRRFDKKRKEKEEDDVTNFEWMLVAKVFDRLFFFIVLLITLVLTLVLLVRRS